VHTTARWTAALQGKHEGRIACEQPEGIVKSKVVIFDFVVKCLEVASLVQPGDPMGIVLIPVPGMPILGSSFFHTIEGV
jgi:hypothetical protein